MSRVIENINEMQTVSDQIRQNGKTIVLVPTMGYLHDGHLSLIRLGRKSWDQVVVSIFVNPTQFGPNEDFESYPRDFSRDLEMCRGAEADIVFHPDHKDLYGNAYQTYVSLEKLPQHLCGLSRPNHFRGVATIVTKLFNIVKPHAAIFGKKDYQQYLIIKQLVRDLNFGIEIIGAPIVREPDGLAMSSRNVYLTSEQRQYALSLSKSLSQAQSMLKNGINQASELIEAARELITSFPMTSVDYISICDPETLDPIEIIDKPVLMALAVKVGKTRLIDNAILQP